MIYESNDIGINSKISLIQRVLEKRLSLKWGTDIHIYGMIQENIKEGNLIPEVYIGDGEYKELYIDDSKAAQICFIVLNRSIESNVHSASIDIIFNVILPSIHGDNERNKERALFEALNILRPNSYINEITGIKEGITDVYSGFYTGQLINKDMQPFYIFAITCNITYSPNLC